MKIQFFLQNVFYGNGSSKIKAKDEPILEVNLPILPDTYMEIDGQWYASSYRPSFHYKTGQQPTLLGAVSDVLDRVEIIIRPTGGEGEMKWQRNQAPFDTERSS